MRRIALIWVSLVAAIPVLAQERHWSHPDFLQLQYAGSIGYLSGGVGYDVFRYRARASLHFGYVPGDKGGPLNIFSTRLVFAPAVYSVGKRITVNPFDIGFMISYHLGSNFRTRWPSHRYPENYYWWQTSFRVHLNYQPSLTIRLRDHTIIKSVSAYLDVNANELYLVSLFQNLESLRPGDVVKLGIGIRANY